MTINTLNILLLASTVMFSACASKSVETQAQPVEKAKSVNDDNGLDDSSSRPKDLNTQDAKPVATDCSSLASNSILKKYSFDLGNDESNLCEIMDSKNISTAVVMITSPTCLSCKPVMKKIGTYLSNKSDMEFIVAVPNRHNDVEAYTIDDVQEMTDESAKNAIPAFDVNAKMWLGLSKDSAYPVFPLVLVINKEAKGKVIQTSELEKEGVVQDIVIPAIEKYSN